MIQDPPDARSYFSAYLRIAPLSLALWRAAEAVAFASVELPRPILDIGCGFGEFGSVFFRRPAEVGLDVSERDLRLALRGGAYERLVLADGRRLPFADGAFASVVSVSVVEHIPAPERVMPEAWRVLRPGGVFALSTPSPRMTDAFLYPRLLRTLRSGWLARAYEARVHRAFRHVSLRPLAEWEAALRDAGFRLRESQLTIPARLALAFDAFLPLALASQAGRAITGRRWVWRPPGAVWLLARLFGSLVETPGAGGCNYFLVADKPG